MSGRVQANVKVPSGPAPSFAPVQSRPLQRKSLLDGTLGLAGEFANYRGKRLVSQPPLIQTKLTINQPNDRYEQEADRVADAVMRMPEPQVQQQPIEEEEELQAKPLAEQIIPLVQRQSIIEEKELQVKELPSQTSEVTQNLESRIKAIKDGGQPLPESTRAFFEPRFGADFGKVRMHSDKRAANIARSIDAHAFTLGLDVVFGGGQYSPASSLGRKLLAHELTHVVQQNGESDVRRKLDLPPIPHSLQKVTFRAQSGVSVPSLVADGTIQRTANVVHRRPVDNRPDIIRFEMDRPANRDALLVEIRTNIIAELDRRVRPPILARIEDLNEDLSDLLDQTEGQGQIVFEISVAWSSSTTVDHVSLLSPYVEPAAALVAEAPSQEREAEGMGTLEEQLSVLERHTELSRSLIQLGIMTMVRQRRTEGYQFGIRICQAVNNAEFINDPALAAVDRVPPPHLHNYMQQDQQGHWFVQPPQIGPFSSQAQIDAFVEGVNSGINDYNLVERYFGIVASILQGAATGLSVSAIAGARSPPVQYGIQRNLPRLRVIQGGISTSSASPGGRSGGGGGVAPTTAVATSRRTVLATEGSAAVAAVTVPVARAATPRPALRVVPDAPPVSAPPISVPVPTAALGAAMVSSTAPTTVSTPAPAPTPAHDVDFPGEPYENDAGCIFEPIAQQYGRYPCHGDFATELSGTRREVRVTTPEGIGRDFDAIDWSGTLYEVKTGYRWLPFLNPDDTRRQDMINRFIDQSTMQFDIADRCNCPLIWYFNEEVVANFFTEQVSLPPPIRFMEFDCDPDSDD